MEINTSTPSDDYNYQNAGFDAFMSRSIDITGNGTTLANFIPTYNPFATNLNQTQVTGSLGNIMQVGNISINGVTGRIELTDSNNNVVIRLGELDG